MAKTSSNTGLPPQSKDGRARDGRVYEFGSFRINPAERQLLRDGVHIPLTGKAFDTLLLLVLRSNHLVERAEIMEEIWPDSFVEESNLSVTVWMLRRALGGKNEECQYIQTVAKRGYRFVADVHGLDMALMAEPALLPPDVILADRVAEIPASLEVSIPDATGQTPDVEDRRRRWLWPIRRSARRVALAGLAIVGTLGTATLATIAMHYRSPRYAVSSVQSIAVLPFQTLNPKEGHESLGLEITDAVITDLGSSGRLQVRPTSDMLQYSDRKDDPRYIGRKEKVDAVLVGSMEQGPYNVRVNAQLVRVADGTMLWARSFVGEPERMPSLADSIAKSLSDLGTVPAAIAVAAAPRREDAHDPKAYKLYLEGRYFWNKRTENGLRRSIEYFQQATLEDDHYAEAYAGLADSYALLGSYGVEPAEQAYPNAKAAAQKALELDSSLAEAHTSLGLISFYYGWDWQQADQEFRLSLAMKPDYAMTHTWYAVTLVAQGRNAEALEEVRKAENLDPMSLIINTEVGRIFYLTRQYDRAIEALQRVIDLDPGFARAHARLGMVYAAKGNFSAAIKEYEAARALTGADPYLDGLEGYAEAQSGNAGAARLLLKDLTERSHQEYVPPFSVALICLGLGDRDRAMELLMQSYQDRSTYMVYAKVDPLLDAMRSDPRFTALLHRMKLA